MPLFDLQCTRCELHLFNEIRRAPDYGDCPNCGTPMTTLWLKFPSTDVYGSEQVCPINDMTYTSRREYERKMKAEGFQPAGDKVGGARNTDMVGEPGATKYSYAHQAKRS